MLYIVRYLIISVLPVGSSGPVTLFRVFEWRLFSRHLMFKRLLFLPSEQTQTLLPTQWLMLSGQIEWNHSLSSWTLHCSWAVDQGSGRYNPAPIEQNEYVSTLRSYFQLTQLKNTWQTPAVPKGARQQWELICAFFEHLCHAVEIYPFRSVLRNYLHERTDIGSAVCILWHVVFRNDIYASGVVIKSPGF